MSKSFKRWTIKDQAYFLEKLGEFLDKGYSLTEAVHLLQFQQSIKRRHQLQLGLELLKNGHPVYEVLQTFQFQDEILSYLYFAEEHGDLSFAFHQAGKMLRKKQEFRKRMQQLATYPTFLLFMLIVLFIFMEKMLLPQFNNLYKSMEIKSSMFMDILFGFPKNISYLGNTILGIVLFLLLINFLIFSRISITKRMAFLIKIPLVNTFIIRRNTHYFCLQLGSLLKGGLPIIDALSVFEKQFHLPFFKGEGSRMKALLLEGESFDEIIKTRPYYEKDLSLIISHAQANGLLAKELHDFSELVMERMEGNMRGVMEILQPTIFTIVGILIIILYLSVMIPLFGMVEGI